MDLIISILALRARQGLRIVKSLGWLIGPIGLAFVFLIYLQLVEALGSGSYAIFFVFGFALLSFHNSREDLLFLWQLSISNYWIYFIEYAIFSLLFFAFPMYYYKNYMLILCLMGTSFLIAAVPPRLLKKENFILPFPVYWIPN